MDDKIIKAAKRLAGITRLTIGAADNKLIVYLTNDFIPNYIPINYEGYVVEVKRVGAIRPCA